MKRELGIARCGLACCACSEEVRKTETGSCSGCDSGECGFAPMCKSRKCSMEKGIKGCYECDTPCEEGVLGKVKVKGFLAFIKKYGVDRFIDCLEKNEKAGVKYHKDGIVGDYDDCSSIDEVITILLSND